MQNSVFEIADVIKRFGPQYIAQYKPNAFILRTLDALTKCRTAALGGHKQKCDCCGKELISYNSCRNRNCPKCQATRQAFWAEDRLRQALPVKHFHMVFTVPDIINEICLLDSPGFYTTLFKCVWDTLRTFGYSHYGVESGAICVLHTWGQNLSLHPHIHCIVPAAGIDLKGKFKNIGNNGKYLYPVHMLSATFKGKILQSLKAKLRYNGLLSRYQSLIDALYKKQWVVDCEASFASPVHIVKYLAQYTHRIAISNQRLMNVDPSGITFMHKDYKDGGRKKPITMHPVEFLRRFCMHILPLRFVKIRYYDMYATKNKAMLPGADKITIRPEETNQQRLLRLTGFDICLCPYCKKGRLVTIEMLPRIRAPASVVYTSATF